MSALPVQVAPITRVGTTQTSTAVAAPALWQERGASTAELGASSAESLLDRLFAVAPEALDALPEADVDAMQLASTPWTMPVLPASDQDLNLTWGSALPAMQVSSHWIRPPHLAIAEGASQAVEHGASLHMLAAEHEQATRARVVQPGLDWLSKDMPKAEAGLEPSTRSLAFHALNSVASAADSGLQASLDTDAIPLSIQPVRNAAERMVSQVLAPSAGADAAAIPVQKGSQALVQALAQRIQVQQVQGMDVATVRLDPPQMGSLEIRIRQDAFGVQVQMHASHHDVARQLVGVAENLRQELLLRSSDVTVSVANSRFAQGGSQQSSQQHARQNSAHDPEVGQALQAWDADSLT